MGVEGCMEKQHCAASHKQRGSLKREDGMTYQHSELNVVRDAINRGTFYPTPPRPLTKLVIEKIWLPPRDSNPDMLIQSQGYYGSRGFLRWQGLSCKLLSFL